MMAENYSSLAKPTVLIVEDEAPLLTLLRYNLEKQGFRVDEAADGQEALHAARLDAAIALRH
jgi:two-component system phosphate regulon response regulator PhoB